MSRQHSWHAHLRRFAFTSLLLLGVATSAFAQFDRGTITGTSQGRAGRHRSRRHRHAHQHPDATSPQHRHRRERLLHISEPDRRPLRDRRPS